MQHPSIGFIGAGNMATALIKGALNRGYPLNKLLACDPSAEQLERLVRNLDSHSASILTSTDNSLADSCDILILAVKPQVLPEVARDLARHIRPDSLIVSVAAGITLELLSRYLPGHPLVRCMPNTPALIGEGATGLYASPDTSEHYRNSVDNLFKSVGLVQWLPEESDLDTVTAVSGSGPAYFFLFMEAMIDASIEMGLDAETARQLCVQTCRGAAGLAAQDPQIAELRKRVTSPNGTTEKAIASFETGGLRDLVKQAMIECAKRSRAMAKEALDK